MKKILLLSIVLLTFTKLATAQEGVRFENITLDQALAAAKESGKLVFVDCYTSWCGPCKKLSSEVFPQKVVGDYINERFVSVKYDVEKEEYKFIAKQYEVKAYPTMLILSSNGEVMDKILGYKTADKLIQSIENSFDRERSLAGLKEKYQAGNMDKLKLVEYYQKLMNERSAEAFEVGEKLYALLSEQERMSNTFWHFYSDERLTPHGSQRFAHLTANYDEFCTNIGKEKVDNVLVREWVKMLKPAISFDDKLNVKELEGIREEYIALGLGKEARLEHPYELAISCQSKKTGKLIKTYGKLLDKDDVVVRYWANVADIIDKTGSGEEKAEWIDISRKVYGMTEDKTLKLVIDLVIERLNK